MNTSQKILVAEDMNTETQDAKRRSRSIREHAIAFAKKLKGSIDLVHAEDLSLYPVEKPYYSSFVESLLKDKERNLKKMAEAAPVKIRPMLLEGSPLARIMELTSSKRNGYGLVVVGTQGRTGLKRILLGSVAEEIIRNSKVPVMTIGPKAQREKPRLTNGETPTILLATALDKNSGKAEEFALETAKTLKAEVILFHGLYGGLHPTLQTAFSTPAGVRELESLMQQLRSDAQKKLKQKEQFFRQRGVECRSVLDDTIGEPEVALLKKARAFKADLIVMGTHGRNLLAQAFLGSTARQTILNAPVPVITVKSA